MSVEVRDLPSGVVAQFSPIEQFFTLRAGAGAATGVFTVTVLASAFFNGAMKTHSRPLPLTITDGYTLAVTAASPTIVRNGAAVTATAMVGRAAGFAGAAAVSLALPNGLSATPAAAVVSPDEVAVDFAVAASCNAAPGDAVVYADGGEGFVGSARSFHLQVVDDFSLALSPATITVVDGGGSQDLRVIVQPPQCQPVIVSLSGVPSGVTATPTAGRLAPLATGTTFSLSAGHADQGTAQLTVTAATADGQLSRQEACTLEVREPPIGYTFKIEKFTIRNTRLPD